MEKKMEIDKIEAAIEAILFTMGDSVEVSVIAKAIEHDEATTKKIINNLMDRYESENRGIKIIEIDNAFQMCTKSEMYDYLIRVASQPKRQILTDVMLETLSIIAYKQPITRTEIENIRGVKCDHAVNKLIEYNLITEVGRMDAPGRPILFGTTEDFLRRFGVQSVEDLPEITSDKYEEFQEEAKEEVQLKLQV
jgi:segregation and condensation protein B